MGDNEPDDSREISSITQYIKATTSATDRTRTVLIVMVVASVVVFTQIRNDDGWFDRRIAVRQHALRLLDSKFDADKAVSSLQAGDRADECLWYERAQYFITKSGYRVDDSGDQARLGHEIEDLTKLRDEQLRLVRLPFFGAVFDADDMGIFAGITFTVVLLWLTLSISRERRNTELSFKIAKTLNKSPLCYDLLAMQQVLYVPPNAPSRIWKPLGYVSKALYILPLVVYGYQFYRDWKTRFVGNALGWDKMNTLLWASGAFFTLILCLTVVCLITSLRMANDWREYAKQASS